MLIAVITLIVGAILGAVLPQAYSEWLARHRQRRLAQAIDSRMRLVGDHSATARWLVEYYDARGAGDNLFRCRIGDFETVIPLLTRSEWITPVAVLPRISAVVEFARTTTHRFDIDDKLIEQRMQLGQRLFDDEACYLDYIEQRDGHVVLHAKACRYFEVATTLVRLEEETFTCRTHPWLPTNWRDQYLPNVSDLNRVLKSPHPIGGAVALAIRDEDGYSVLMHTRSHATITVGGLKAVMPNFTLAPPPPPDYERPTIRPAHQLDDVLLFNVVREYLEELFNCEPLIMAAADSRLNPYWFGDLPEAKRCLDLATAGNLSLEFLGFGFDALSGSGVMALLMTIDDAAFGADLRETVEANWEVGRGEGGRVDAAFISTRDRRLTQWLEEERYHSGAAFTLALGLPRLLQREEIVRSGGQNPTY